MANILVVWGITDVQILFSIYLKRWLSGSGCTNTCSVLYLSVSDQQLWLHVNTRTVPNSTASPARYKCIYNGKNTTIFLRKYDSSSVKLYNGQFHCVTDLICAIIIIHLQFQLIYTLFRMCYHFCQGGVLLILLLITQNLNCDFKEILQQTWALKAHLI